MDERTPNRDDPDRDDEHNELGYRDVDEQAAYDERGGTQGPSEEDPPPDED